MFTLIREGLNLIVFSWPYQSCGVIHIVKMLDFFDFVGPVTMSKYDLDNSLSMCDIYEPHQKTSSWTRSNGNKVNQLV